MMQASVHQIVTAGQGSMTAKDLQPGELAAALEGVAQHDHADADAAEQRQQVIEAWSRSLPT